MIDFNITRKHFFNVICIDLSPVLHVFFYPEEPFEFPRTIKSHLVLPRTIQEPSYMLKNHFRQKDA